MIWQAKVCPRRDATCRLLAASLVAAALLASGEPLDGECSASDPGSCSGVLLNSQIPLPSPAPRPARRPFVKDLAPWQTFGAGCQSIKGRDKAGWLRALSNRSFNPAALLPESEAFACYSGSAAAELDPKPKLWRDAGFVDNAVVLVEDFLSAEEVEHFRNLLVEHGKVSHGNPTVRHFYAGGAQYGDGVLSGHPELDVHMKEDKILNAVEARMGAALGIPPSSEEIHLQCMMTIGRPDLLGMENKMQAIHHDKNSGLTRQATAIIYLSDVEEGGETVFPALPVHPSGPVPRTAEMRKIGQALKKVVKGKLDHMVPEVPWPPLTVEQDTDAEIFSMMTKACPASGVHSPSAGNRTAPLIVKPVPGRAIFFWHETRRKGNAIFDNFHVGCPVKQGVKLALQKFKHFASKEEGCLKSRWCRVGMERAEEYARVKKAFTTD